ncbi:MAG: serine protease, partial [Pseudomonadota bacterium]
MATKPTPKATRTPSMNALAATVALGAVLAVAVPATTLAQGYLPSDVNALPAERGAQQATRESQAQRNTARLRNIVPPIVGGSDASLGEFPHQVSLMDASAFNDGTAVERHFCGGSIIGDVWVLTAAHCVEFMIGNQEFFSIGAGSTDLEELEEYALDGIWIHPRYDSSTFDYDFAIIRVNRPLNDREIPVVTRADNQFIRVGNTASISGWGVDGTGEIQRMLQRVDVKVVSRNDCNDADSYDGAITQRMICLGLEEGGQDSCQGDSGGPAITRVQNDAQVLFGVVSWGFGCAEPERFGVYARIISVKGWIDEIID